MAFVGGDEAVLARVRPLLDPMCKRVEWVGPHGAGSTMKLAVNLPLRVYWQTLSEALSLVEPLKLDPQRVIDILSDSSGGPKMLKVRGGMIAQALAGTVGPQVMVDLATSGCLTAVATSRCRRSKMSLWVLAGANTPFQPSSSMLGKPSSLTVGTSGRPGMRLEALVAMALSVPALISAKEVQSWYPPI